MENLQQQVYPINQDSTVLSKEKVLTEARTWIMYSVSNVWSKVQIIQSAWSFLTSQRNLMASNRQSCTQTPRECRLKLVCVSK